MERRDLFLQRSRNLWHEEYLLGLGELTHDFYQSDFNNVIAMNDMVFIRNPAKSRPYWSLGRVIRVTPGGDSCIRSTLVKKFDGTTQEYSLKHLFPLELSISHSRRTSEPPEELSDSEDIIGLTLLYFKWTLCHLFSKQRWRTHVNNQSREPIGQENHVVST